MADYDAIVALRGPRLSDHAVHVKDARKMAAAYEEAKKQYPDLKFGIMFQQRTYGFWRKIKEMIDGGELGRLMRATWIISMVTTWLSTVTLA